MKHVYLKYKNEILAFIGVISPILIGYLGPVFTSNAITSHFSLFWYYYVIVSLIFLIIMMRRKSDKERENYPLSLYANKQKSFQVTLDLSHSTFWYLGMGAEEFLRDIDVEKYFASRSKSAKPIRELRLLFLHPESEAFRNRITEVNDDGDLESIISAKKGYLAALNLALESLSKDSLKNYEIRYYSEQPVWQLQFYNIINNQDDESCPFGVFIRMHIPYVHSKYCKLYHCARDDHHIFEGYLGYFERVWNDSTPVKTPGKLPKLKANQ